MAHIDEKAYRELFQQQKWAGQLTKAASAGQKKTVAALLIDFDTQLNGALARNMNAVICDNSMYGPENQSAFAIGLCRALYSSYFEALTHDRRYVFDMLGSKIQEVNKKAQPYLNTKELFQKEIFTQGHVLGRTQNTYYLDTLLPYLQIPNEKHHKFQRSLSESIGKSVNHVAFDFFLKHNDANTATAFLRPHIVFEAAYCLTAKSSNIKYVGDQEKFLEHILDSSLFSDIKTHEAFSKIGYQNANQVKLVQLLMKKDIVPTQPQLIELFARIVYTPYKELNEKKEVASYLVHYMFDKGLRQTIKTIEKEIKNAAYNITAAPYKAVLQDLYQLSDALQEKIALEHKLPKEPIGLTADLSLKPNHKHKI